jgi:hypothetical protein
VRRGQHVRVGEDGVPLHRLVHQDHAGAAVRGHRQPLLDVLADGAALAQHHLAPHLGLHQRAAVAGLREDERQRAPRGVVPGLEQRLAVELLPVAELHGGAYCAVRGARRDCEHPRRAIGDGPRGGAVAAGRDADEDGPRGLERGDGDEVVVELRAVGGADGEGERRETEPACSLAREASSAPPLASPVRRTCPLKYRVQSPPCARPSCPPRRSQCACATATMLDAALRVRVLRRRRSHRVRRRGRRSLDRVGDDDDDEGGREPVLLVSGMGGSVLHARRRSNSKFDLRVWVRILFANLDFKKYVWSLYNADTSTSRSTSGSRCACGAIPDTLSCALPRTPAFCTKLPAAVLAVCVPWPASSPRANHLTISSSFFSVWHWHWQLAMQGLDPLTTAGLFAEGQCMGEKKVNGEDCFILKLSADPQMLKLRSEGPGGDHPARAVRLLQPAHGADGADGGLAPDPHPAVRRRGRRVLGDAMYREHSNSVTEEKRRRKSTPDGVCPWER